MDIEVKLQNIQNILDNIYDYFQSHKNVYVNVIEQLDDCNGYLGDERWDNMAIFDEWSTTPRPLVVAGMVYDGRDINGDRFNPYSDYFRFNRYGTLESSDEKNYDDFLTDDFLLEALSYRDDLPAVNENKVLSNLYDKLSMACPPSI